MENILVNNLDEVMACESTIDDIMVIDDTLGSSGALDTLSAGIYANVVGAYAMCRLFKQYIGAQIRIRRSTNNEEIDVYFDKNGYALNVDLDVWLSGATGYIVIWYDQGPTKNNTIGYAAGGTILPRLFKRTDTGFVGRYAAYLTGSSTTVGNYFKTTNSVTFNEVAQGGISTFTVANFLTATNYEHAFDYGTTSSTSNNLKLYRFIQQEDLVFQYYVGGTSTGIQIPTAAISSAWKTYGGRVSGANPNWTYALRVNGVVGTYSYANRNFAGSRTLTTNYIGRSHDSTDSYANMYIACQIFINDDIPNAQFIIMEGIF